jgi:hypothetical protein
MMLFVLAMTLLAATLVSGQAASCYADVIDPYLLFATATPYEVVNEMSARPVLPDRKYHGTR